ncbi:MAG: 2-oxoacid:acceptor oxidoreductase subunit alpha [Gammaproteobacteria bacterium]
MAAVAEELKSLVVRFAGDSGDGIQLAGARFTDTAALAGADFSTFPDFPAEIRAPAGTLAGVSAFQIHLSSQRAWTPGDAPDVLVAMNPAALKANLGDLVSGGTILLNSGAFDKKGLAKAGYTSDPREDGSLEGYRVLEADVSRLTEEALEGLGLSHGAVRKHKNFLVLGMVYWLFQKDPEPTLRWIEDRFRKSNPTIADANIRALKAGYHYGETQEWGTPVRIAHDAPLAPGRYRRITGNEASALGLMAAAERAGLELVLASYPITPASDILHYLSRHQGLGVRTLQLEDEIAAICAAVGASYAGGLGVTSTSGPGMALKSEALGLAVALELPLIVLDVQRAGPSTGLPTKVEQADLLQACFGRHGEAPLPVIAAASPGDAFWTMIEAARIAIRFMTPVVVLSDGFLANSSEPWRIPELSEIPPIPVRFAREGESFAPYQRNADLARPWALPGTPGLAHRIGGLEKAEIAGTVSYEGDNHERMVQQRAQKIRNVADSYEPSEIHGDTEGDLLVIGWGGTRGALRAATDRVRRESGRRVGHLHLRHIHPLPKDLTGIVSRFGRVVVAEINNGQLVHLLRAETLVDMESFNRAQGRPFHVAELAEAFHALLERGS